MRIRIKGEGRNLSIVLPTVLVFSKVTARLAGYFGRKYTEDTMNAIPPVAVEILFDEFRRIKKKYGTWELVDIESSTGEQVKVIL